MQMASPMTHQPPPQSHMTAHPGMAAMVNAPVNNSYPVVERERPFTCPDCEKAYPTAAGLCARAASARNPRLCPHLSAAPHRARRPAQALLPPASHQLSRSTQAAAQRGQSIPARSVPCGHPSPQQPRPLARAARLEAREESPRRMGAGERLRRYPPESRGGLPVFILPLRFLFRREPGEMRFACPVEGCDKAYATSMGIYQHKRSKQPQLVHARHMRRPSPAVCWPCARPNVATTPGRFGSGAARHPGRLGWALGGRCVASGCAAHTAAGGA